MSLFRKQPQTAPPTPTGSPEAATPSNTLRMFEGANVDLAAIYQTSKLHRDELDRVARAEALLCQLPRKASHTREIVEATFRAFGVDQTMILDSAKKQLDALEAFIRFSHGQTQHVLDASAFRITELQAEIERCREAAAQATREGEERARTVNNELVKVQRVLEFFGQNVAPDDYLDGPTFVQRPEASDDSANKPNAGKSPSGKPAQGPS